MKSSNTLRDEYGVLSDQLDAIANPADGNEAGALSQEERTLVEDLTTKMDALEKEIALAVKVEARLNKRAQASTVTDIRHKKEPETEESKTVKRYSFLKAIERSSKREQLDGLEAEMHQEAVKEARRSNLSIDGFGIPSMFFKNPNSEKRDLVAGTPTAYGNTIPTEVGTLIDYLWPRTTLESLGATVLSGLTSNVSFPRKNAVPAATWEGETDANAESDPTTDAIALTPKRLGTYVDVSKQLIMQSSVPGLDTMVRRDIETAIAQALEIAALVGSGTNNQPTGILVDNNVLIEAIGTNGGALTWSHIVALEAAISNQNADMGKLGYLTTPGIRGLLKTTEKAANTAQFIWENQAMAGVTPTIGEGQLNGYRAAISTLVPSDLVKGSGINLHALIFGDFSQLMMGQFGGLDVVVDPYTQARNTLVRVVLNSWWDIALRHSQSFAAIKDASAGVFNT